MQLIHNNERIAKSTKKLTHLETREGVYFSVFQIVVPRMHFALKQVSSFLRRKNCQCRSESSYKSGWSEYFMMDIRILVQLIRKS